MFPKNKCRMASSLIKSYHNAPIEALPSLLRIGPVPGPDYKTVKGVDMVGVYAGIAMEKIAFYRQFSAMLFGENNNICAAATVELRSDTLKVIKGTNQVVLQDHRYQ